VQRGFQLGEVGHLLRPRAEALGMGGEVDVGQGLVARVGQQVVERRAAGRRLQPVDAAIAPVVEQVTISLVPSITEVASSELSIR
jgi:hypothetical protein